MEQTSKLLDYETRDRWLAGRRSRVGASEVAILFGLAPEAWGSPYSLWAEKTGRKDRDDLKGEWLEWGHKLEPIIAAEYELRTGRKCWADVRPYAVAVDAECERLGCTPDRWVVEAPGMPGNGVLQLKNSAWYAGQDWTAGIPDHIVFQVQAEMACTGVQWGSAAVLKDGNRYFHHDLRRDENLIRDIRDHVTWFYGLVERGEPPPVDGSEATAKALKKMHPADNGATVALPAEAALWVADWMEAKLALSTVKKTEEKRAKVAENRIKAAIGSATFGVLPGGQKLSLKTISKKGHEVRPTTYRQLKVDNGKADGTKAGKGKPDGLFVGPFDADGGTVHDDENDEE